MSPSENGPARIALGAGVEIPQLGLGVFQVPAADTAEVVAHALDAGYRHIDTAAAYGNERGVGEALRASGLARDEVFVTTKCWNSNQGSDEARRALDASLKRLGMDQVDLYLIHWPVPSRDRYVETWRALVAAREEGLTRAIGVSNFQAAHLTHVIEETGVTPSVNQIELHPRLTQSDLRRTHERLGVVTEIARAHSRTPGQVLIRWHLQLGHVVIPKSATPSRIADNFDVFDFELDASDLAAIEGLDRGERTGPDPDTFALA